MPDKAWKAAERRIAKFLGVERNALSGGNSKVTRSDTLHPEIYLESKWSARSSLWTLWKDTKKKAQAEGKIPVVCQFLKSHEGAILSIHIKDLLMVLEIIKRAHEHNSSKSRKRKRKKKKATRSDG